ncbi:HIT family protein [Pseudomonas sp. Leaf48]|uniref:HIT family protein n=1 Tax=Pseudomonas sp. Leaf48 TaxID=1736221 RepID=UPI000A5E3DD5|nr:HIT family protein [Pseudomonas sp. Leaf48]
MEVASQFIIHQTAHWILNHHMSSALPGYLMLGAREHVSSLADLPADALAELGGLFATIQKTLETRLKPKWLYISRFGHVPGYPIHFHFIPVYHWVEELFWKDHRYRLLETFASIENAASITDGAELTLFIWREFGERPQPPAIQGPSINQVIEDLRGAYCRAPNTLCVNALATDGTDHQKPD